MEISKSDLFLKKIGACGVGPWQEEETSCVEERRVDREARELSVCLLCCRQPATDPRRSRLTAGLLLRTSVYPSTLATFLDSLADETTNSAEDLYNLPLDHNPASTEPRRRFVPMEFSEIAGFTLHDAYQ